MVENLGLVAFNQIKTKYDGEGNPVVGSFEWDMTAPSYVSPLAEYVGGKLIPGFVACDFLSALIEMKLLPLQQKHS